MDFSEDAIFGIIQSNNPFPVDFEDAWRWIGYSRKSDAKKCLRELSAGSPRRWSRCVIRVNPFTERAPEYLRGEYP